MKDKCLVSAITFTSIIRHDIVDFKNTAAKPMKILKKISVKTLPHARIRTVAKDTLSRSKTYSKQKDEGSKKTVIVCVKMFILHSRRKSMKP